MRFLIRLKADVPARKLLDAVRPIAGTLGADPRSPKVTSYGALELDVFTRSRDDFDLFLAAIGPLAQLEFARDLSVPSPFKPEAEHYAEARDLFNAERYWECHEVLEGVWRTKGGEEKRLLQGIILVCAAFVHHQKGEESVALGVLRRALPQLDFRAAGFGGFSLTDLREGTQKILSTGRFVEFRV